MCSRIILAVRLRTDEDETAFGSFKNVLCMFKIIFRRRRRRRAEEEVDVVRGHAGSDLGSDAGSSSAGVRISRSSLRMKTPGNSRTC